MVNLNSRGFLAWWCSFTILLSAFLLFQVQPVISKMILPWFGGSPGVWTTCMLFFQLLLLAGYAYAHGMTQSTQAGRQAVVHVVLLLAALLLLPIIPATSWKPTGAQNPSMHILLVLAATVGLPYFLLSATGPLVQTWFSRVCPGRSPYWLYALSNVGSLGALLSYPFLVEPRWTSHQQGTYWSFGFAVFAVACGGLAVKVFQVGRIVPTQTWDEAVAEAEANNAPLPAVWRRLTWVALPALGCVALLATTNHLCQDVAVVPFMWVAPLSMYLISFILAFAGNWAYPRRTMLLLAAGGILLVVGLQRNYDVAAWLRAHDWIDGLNASETKLLEWLKPIGGDRLKPALGIEDFSLEQLNESIFTHVGIYLFAMWAICMVCHGELARLRPATRHLTRFFLMSSAGGALGGIFVALACPAIFVTYMELHWMLTVSFAVLLAVAIVEIAESWTSESDRPRWIWKLLSLPTLVLLVPGQFLVIQGQRLAVDTNDLDTARSFYGVLHVEVANEDNPAYHGLELLNGRILHGYQLLDEFQRRRPTTYYTRSSGAGVTIEGLRRVEASDEPARPGADDTPLIEDTPLRVAVVGLGVGTMAAYGQKGDVFRFYEINPQVVDFAQRHFTFLSDCPADHHVVLGDARLSMERQEPQGFHALILDAFSGDAIPVHLLTRESFEIYLRHMHPRGVIAVHVSNRHIDLIPVVSMLAQEFQLEARLVSHPDSNGSVECASDWVLVTRSQPFLRDFQVHQASRELTEQERQGPLWTDQFSNLLGILK